MRKSERIFNFEMEEREDKVLLTAKHDTDRFSLHA